MAALSGLFLADFASFDAACQKTANVELPKIEGGAARVGAGVDRMVGVAAPRIDSLRSSLSQFDSTLSAVGVNLGPQIRAVGELGDVAGKTAGQVGALGTAGLVISTAMAGWGLGRQVADFFDLDAIIGDATASLLGWGDAAGQVAAANAETLAKASAHAGIEITDLNVAMQINREAVGAMAAGHAAAAVSVTTVADAVEEANARILAGNAATLAGLEKELAARAVVHARTVAAAEAISALDADLAAQRLERDGTFYDQAVARIDADVAHQRAAFIQKQTDDFGHYDARSAAAREFEAKLATYRRQGVEAASVDLDFLEANSIEHLEAIAARHRATYEAMTGGSLRFSREVMEEQLRVTREAEDAARGMGAAYQDGLRAAAAEAASLADELVRVRAEADAAAVAARAFGGSIDLPGFSELSSEQQSQVKNALLPVKFGGGGLTTAEAQALVQRLLDERERGTGRAGDSRGRLVAEDLDDGPAGRPGLGGGARRGMSITVPITVSGILDPRTIRELSAGVEAVLTTRLLQGAKYG